jgi:prepilin-type N-terminal cleavage/methylation domain-containing protein
MLTRLKRKDEGFTIVETLIVLAIAGLIILIVLLAVPALQRSSRNSNIKSDASAIASSVSDFESNNDGYVPNEIGTTSTNLAARAVNGPTVYVGSTTDGGGAPASSTIQPTDTVNVASGVTNGIAFNENPTTPQVGPGFILIDEGVECPASTETTVTGLITNSRTEAIFYPVETGASTGGVGCIQD